MTFPSAKRAALAAAISLTTLVAVAAQQGKRPPGQADFKPFTGALMVRQEGGQLYYKVFVSQGAVIGGYEGFGDNQFQYHRAVGGWFDGQRLSLLMQASDYNWGDKWFSHCHQFERQGDKFVLVHTLYGFGRTLQLGGVHTPHVLEQLEELPEETVRRLAASMIAGKALTVLNVEDPLMQTLADLEGAVGDANLEAVDDLLGEELRRKDNGRLPPPLAALRDNVVQRNEQDNVRGLLVQFKNVRKLIAADMVVYDGKAEQVTPVEFTVEHTAEGWRIVDVKLAK